MTRTPGSPNAAPRFATAIAAAVVAATLVSSVPAQAQLPTNFHDQSLVTGLDSPVAFAFLPDGRVLIDELKTGMVRMIVNGAIASTDPVFTVDSLETGGEETGLLGIAIDPRWPSKPYVYLYYTAVGNTIRLARYTAVGDVNNSASGSLALDPASKRYLIRNVESVNDNHNAGTLAFGPDSMLYASFGEDARACLAFIFDSSRLYGVIARMEVRNLPDTPGPFDLLALAPPDNPFPTHWTLEGRLVYAFGLRNPFRFAIDRPTGNLFIADVGWLSREEVDIATPGGGQHFGWPYFEGSTTYVTTECGPPPPSGLIDPVFQYDRASYGGGAAAIIGGVLYRPVTGSIRSFPAEYEGDYFFSDYYEGFIWRLHPSGGTWSLAAPVAGQPNARDWARGYAEVTQWTIGPDGAIYYARLANDYTPGTGEFRRIVYQDPNVSAPEPTPASRVALAVPYPTPAHGAVTLSYTLSRVERVRLSVYDTFGRRVRALESGAERPAGEHRARWDGRDDSGRSVPPGIYLVRLNAGDETRDRRLVLSR